MHEVKLRMKQIKKSFSSVSVLKGVDLEARSGEVLALLGTNGAGKSTLMNILCGLFKQNSGEIELDGKVVSFNNPTEAAEAGIAFVQQEMTLMPTMSIVDNLFLTNYKKKAGLIQYKELKEKCKEALAKLGCNYDPDTLIQNLGAGDRQLVQITRSLLMDPHIIIFDEATSSLTPREKQRLFKVIRSLRDSGATIIYITHMMDEISEICDKLMVLRDGVRSGMMDAKEYNKAELVSTMVGDKAKEMNSAHRTVKSFENSPVYMKVDHWTETGVVSDISFELHSGEVMGLWGLLGAGRTELVRSLCGLDPVDSGEVAIIQGEKLEPISPKQLLKKIAYVTEDRRVDGLALKLSVKENMASANLKGQTNGTGIFIDEKKEAEICDKYVKELSIKISSVNQPIGTLSGGNQQKVIIGRWLQKNPQIYIFDEPTRGLDIGAKADILKMIHELSQQGAAVLVIMSDIEEIMSVCHRYLVLHNGKVTAELPYTATQEELMAASDRMEA